MRKFIQRNLTLLTSKTKNQIKEIKRKKNEYWRKISNIGIPKNPDLALATTFFLIDKNKLKTQEDLNTLLEISAYLNKYLYTKDLEDLKQLMESKREEKFLKSYLKPQDHIEIKVEEYFEKKNIDNSRVIVEPELTIKDEPELLRKYGYDILINRFEPLLRKVLINEVLILNYGIKNWKNEIPKGVIQFIDNEKEVDINTTNINDYFEELYLWSLKEIAIYSDHFKHLECLIGDLSKNKFIEYMDDLNEIRKKIAHAKSTFSGIDFSNLIFIIKQICQDNISEDLIKYINNQAYKKAEEIPPTFFSEYIIPNNLPTEDYDLDGGFVGRKNEIDRIKRLLYSEQDRILSITGAGGIGKTAVAIKTSYNILADNDNPFEAIIWFSAKATKLTAEHGIVPIKPDIESCEQLVNDILSIADPKTLEIFKQNQISHEIAKKHLYQILSTRKCLLIIDNLETIKDEDTIDLIKDIPRPSQVLITSRKGLGELERRYELPEFNENDAIKLFRIISKERNKADLLRLSNNDILMLVKCVKCYPLLIKWSIGKVCLGKGIQLAFSEIYSGGSEIAEFVFNDVFELLGHDSKICLYSMIVYGDKSVSRSFLQHLANLDDNSFDDAIRELIISSFIYPETISKESVVLTHYCMLSLTRGFIQYKLDEDQKELINIKARYYELSRQIQEYEKSKSSYYQSMISLGVKTDDEKIAFTYVKSAKNYEKNEEFEEARKNYENAIKTAPNFPYALIEYAKFEYYQGHTQQSEDLYIQAINADSKNWHSYFHYGICLKKLHKIIQSIHNLEKAKELYPDYLPIYNELGRVYTFNAEYEKADKQFENATRQEQYPNYRHKFITLQFQADNYRRWSESFFERKDYDGGMEKLKLALNTIQEANTLKRGDLLSQRLEKNICLNVAINLCEMGKFEDAIPYFERCFEKIRLKNGMITSYDEEMASAYYNIAKYGIRLNTLNTAKSNEYITKGLSITHDSELIKKLKTIKNTINRESKIFTGNRKLGIIDYVNIPKKYGIVNSENHTYLFFFSGFIKFLDTSELYELEGKEVSFNLTDNPKKKGEKIAVNISLESE